MSAFLVSNRTLNWIVTAIEKSKSELEGYTTRLDILDDADLSPKDLFFKLLSLNQKALLERYGDKDKDVHYCYHPEECPSMFQFCKSLRCFLYQCSEGNIPETSELFKELNVLSGRIAVGIVCSSPEYDSAIWD